MKNTTFRKKALLSSVAMLLVALVALGSATFAWFTQNPTVNADGLILKASAAAGLQIVAADEADEKKDANKTEIFDTKTTLNANSLNADGEGVTNPAGVILGTPVSHDQSNNSSIIWSTGTAVAEYEYDADATTFEDGASPSYKETIYLRKSIDSDVAVTVKSAKVTFTKATAQLSQNVANNMNLYDAIRVSIFDGNALVGTWAPDGEGNLYVTNKALSSSKATYYKDKGVATMNKAISYVTDANYAQADSVELVIWLDGEDDACYTKNVDNLKDLVSSINVQFSTETLS